MSRMKSSGGCDLGLMEELLRVLPDLRGVSSEGEPKTDEVRLRRKKKGRKEEVSSRRKSRRRGKRTNEEENSSAEVHEMLDRILVERILCWVGMRVSAALAHPGLATDGLSRRETDRRVGATSTAELELEEERREEVREETNGQENKI